MSTSLMLQASRASWSSSSHHGTEWDQNSKMKKIRDQILKRDRFVCQGCGWRSERWQEIHHKDNNHNNFDPMNLETLCPLCHQIFHLPTAASTGGGSLIWLPEMSQAQLNLLCIGVFVALHQGPSRVQAAARALFHQLESRKALMEEQLGSCNPGLLAQVLLRMTDDEKKKQDYMLSSVRLLPYHTRFQSAISYWSEESFKHVPVSDWEKMWPKDIDLSHLVKERMNTPLKEIMKSSTSKA